MKIDFHVHVTPPDIIKNYKKIGEREAYFNLLSSSPKNKFATAEDVIDELAKSGVDQAVIFGFSFNDQGLCREVNDYVIEAVKKYPDKLIGFMSVSPNSTETEGEMDRCLAKGLIGIGELFPDGQDFPIENAKRTVKFAGYCLERDLPVIIHSNEPVGHYYQGKTSTTPVKLDAFVEHNPELITIFAHWGGGLFFYELMQELKEKYRNVYYDTAASPFLYRPDIYRVAREAGALEKILLASDYPLLSPSENRAELSECGLSAEEQKLVRGENALNLLNMLKRKRSGCSGRNQ